jgi:hypothetical protein
LHHFLQDLWRRKFQTKEILYFHLFFKILYMPTETSPLFLTKYEPLLILGKFSCILYKKRTSCSSSKRPISVCLKKHRFHSNVASKNRPSPLFPLRKKCTSSTFLPKKFTEALWQQFQSIHTNHP